MEDSSWSICLRWLFTSDGAFFEPWMLNIQPRGSYINRKVIGVEFVLFGVSECSGDSEFNYWNRPVYCWGLTFCSIITLEPPALWNRYEKVVSICGHFSNTLQAARLGKKKAQLSSRGLVFMENLKTERQKTKPSKLEIIECYLHDKDI